jgi:hypothetical protein
MVASRPKIRLAKPMRHYRFFMKGSIAGEGLGRYKVMGGLNKRSIKHSNLPPLTFAQL